MCKKEKKKQTNDIDKQTKNGTVCTGCRDAGYLYGDNNNNNQSLSGEDKEIQGTAKNGHLFTRCIYAEDYGNTVD